MSATHKEIKVGILGATGTVGQRFIQLLSTHPYFRLHALGASSRSAGQTYAAATKWKLATPIPKDIAEMVVTECDPSIQAFKECGVVFSGLDDRVGEIGSDTDIKWKKTWGQGGDGGPWLSGRIRRRTGESKRQSHWELLLDADAFRRAELIVFSNAKNYRRDPLVPLIVPTVNPSHLSVVRAQQSALSLKSGYLVTNANCSTTCIVVPLRALEVAFGPLKTIMVTTLQAISGAGYPGVASLDILDNVVPYIGSEEEKMEWETNKILGGVTPSGDGFDLHSDPAPINISAACNRVPVIDGHTACVSVAFQRSPAPSPEEIKKALREYKAEVVEMGCPSAPKESIVVHEAQDRPQPRLDKDLYAGAAVHVGRVRECKVLDIKFVCMLDNVRLGAATSSVINAEYAVEKGYIH